MDGEKDGGLRLKACTDQQLFEAANSGKCCANVIRLCVAESQLTDACLTVLPTLFPRLEELHAQKTKLSGKGLDTLLAALPGLRVINMDEAAVTSDCARALLNAYKSRQAATHASELAVSVLRVGELDTKWSKLLEVACNGRAASTFRVRTDLQKPFGQRPCHAIQVHETVAVHVHLDGYPPFEMVHLGVPASRPIVYVAKDAVTELNLVASGDVKVVAEPSVAGRRAKYRAAFEELYTDGHFFSKTFKTGRVWLETLDLLSGTTTTANDVHDKLMGPVQHKSRKTVHVQPVTVSNLDSMP